MTEDGYAAVVERLSQDRRICVTTHESPDGDALGSLLGAGIALRGAGYDVAFYLSGSDAYPAEYRFLPVEEIDRQPPADAAGARPVRLRLRQRSPHRPRTRACSSASRVWSTSTTTTTTPASAT